MFRSGVRIIGREQRADAVVEVREQEYFSAGERIEEGRLVDTVERARFDVTDAV